MSIQKIGIRLSYLLALGLGFAGSAPADEIAVRLTQLRGVTGFSEVLAQVNLKAGTDLKVADFELAENRELYRSHFEYWVQTLHGLPLRGRSIRIWSQPKAVLEGEVSIFQAEANIERPESAVSSLSALRISGGAGSSLSALTRRLRANLSSDTTRKVALKWLESHPSLTQEDSKIRELSWNDEWVDGRPVRAVKARAKYGVYALDVSLLSSKVLKGTYHPFPREDQATEWSTQALVYPIYEETERSHEILGRIPVELKYLKSQVRRPVQDPYEPLRGRSYPESKLDPVLGETEAGRAEGYWSAAWLKREASILAAQVPLSPNDPSSANGAVLEGRYASINIHPDAAKAFGASDLALSSQFLPVWREQDDGSYSVIPSAGLLGLPLVGSSAALDRVVRRLPDHSPATYLRDGFDEVQVYFAINELFDSLRPMGWMDPELSSRPFHAYLYDPDVSMRDNAYYTDDTINFTTYSPSSINYARDNSTIWHELGHGVMDRMMGDHLSLADTGGLSEGMADFVAALVIEDVSQGIPFPGSTDFRIINQTGFGLTNEVHDDGEAYGGAMHDLLQKALTKFGRQGLVKITDLTLEAMRLTRNHPHLTAEDWFSHLYFADSLGAPGVRDPGELSSLLTDALAGRNFSLDPTAKAAEFAVQRDGIRLESSGPGSRGQPVRVSLAEGDTAVFNLDASVIAGTAFAPTFPARVRLAFNEGALQGAVHWGAAGKDETSGSQEIELKSGSDHVVIPVTVAAQCDEVNRDDGSCVDYVYLKLFDSTHGDQPIAKKRFYVRVTKKN